MCARMGGHGNNFSGGGSWPDVSQVAVSQAWTQRIRHHRFRKLNSLTVGNTQAIGNPRFDQDHEVGAKVRDGQSTIGCQLTSRSNRMGYNQERSPLQGATYTGNDSVMFYFSAHFSNLLLNAIARMIINPLAISCCSILTLSILMPLFISPINNVPITVRLTEPLPPAKLVPPRTIAAMTSSSIPVPYVDQPVLVWDVSIRPPIAAPIPEMT